MDAGITIRIPHLPVIEVLLLSIAVLLWRLLSVAHEGLRLLRGLQAVLKESSSALAVADRADRADGLRAPRLSRQTTFSRPHSRPDAGTPSQTQRTAERAHERDDASRAHIGGSGSGERLVGEQPARPLQLSAGQFAKCMAGEADVDVGLFIAACQNYCKVQRMTMCIIPEHRNHPCTYRCTRHGTKRHAHTTRHAGARVHTTPTVQHTRRPRCMSLLYYYSIV